MKAGRSLTDIATELQRQVETKRDYLASQGAIEVKVVDGEIVADGFNGSALGITNFAHGQIAQHLSIPQKYYDRMKVEQPELLAKNVNTWLHKDGEERRMVRALDGKVRAFLSPKYRPLDNSDLLAHIVPVLSQLPDFRPTSLELTETRFYIKGILESLSDKLPEGMTWGSGHNAVGAKDGLIVAAVSISNSDVGNGALKVEPSVYSTWCTNLAIMKSAAMRKYHVGRGFEADDNLEIYRDETRQADDRAFWLKVQDVTKSAFDRQVWERAVAAIRAAGQVEIVSKELPTVVEVAVKQLALPERTTGTILTNLAKNGDLSKWGLSSAITEAANTDEDYEVATQLERAGGEVLALEGRAWDTIATAVPVKKAA